MARKGGRIKCGGWKWLVPRHGRGNKANANQAEKAIETRERRAGRAEIAEQLEDIHPERKTG